MISVASEAMLGVGAVKNTLSITTKLNKKSIFVPPPNTKIASLATLIRIVKVKTIDAHMLMERHSKSAKRKA
jgi:hypothetical protein